MTILPYTFTVSSMSIYLSGYPVVNDPLYNHDVFGPEKGKGGRIGKSDEQLIQDLISIHNAENWLGMDDDSPGGGLGPAPVSIQPSVSPKDDAKKQRSDTPDSAVDLVSLPTSADSPSSSSPASMASCGEYQMDNVGANSVKAKEKASNSIVEDKVTIATQTGIEEADKGFDIAKLSSDHHCYECKVKYRDPRPKDLVMFLHAWTYAVSSFGSI
jgi:hypothetical protein